MEIVILMPILLGFWFKWKDGDFLKYRRTLIINVFGFTAIACVLLLVNYQRTVEIGVQVCRSGFGPALVGLALYRSFRTYKGQTSRLGCLAPVLVYFQFMLFLAFSIYLMMATEADGEIGRFLTILFFVGLMASLGVIHAWAGPILAGFNIGTGLAAFLTGEGDVFFVREVFEWMRLGPFAQWLWLIASTVMSLASYWERIMDVKLLDAIADKLGIG